MRMALERAVTTSEGAKVFCFFFTKKKTLLLFFFEKKSQKTSIRWG
jgi:hypothetical protein